MTERGRIDLTSHLLDDDALRQFIAKGYILIQSDQSAEFHQQVCMHLDQVLEREGNPGNNILPRVPQIGQVFDSAPVRGALTSLLGADYSMHPHRYYHVNLPGGQGQDWHKDDYIFDQNVRHHRFRWVMAFYYPQDVREAFKCGLQSTINTRSCSCQSRSNTGNETVRCWQVRSY